MPTPVNRKFAWLDKAPVTHLVAALGAEDCRFVGGVVRDSLLKRPIGDIDVATTHPPDKVQSLLKAKRIKVIPTGVKHGTITAIADGQIFEVTTLRADVKTHGRHADVAFHDNWEEDARRRDFTINAIYLSPAGQLFDYFNGQKDLKKGRIKFIGKAENRIKEDALRILRFFRFHAWYGKGKLDPAGLKACESLIKLLDILSIERVRDELFKTLAAAEPVAVIREMKKIGIFQHLFKGVGPDIDALEKLVIIETILKKISPLRRLKVLLPMKPEALSTRLKLSNKQARRLFNMGVALLDCLDARKVRRIIYRDDKQAFEDRLLLQGGDIDPIKVHLKTAATFKIPVFPVRGADLQKRGLSPGKEMGKVLKDLEKAWIESDFQLSKKELMTHVG